MGHTESLMILSGQPIRPAKPLLSLNILCYHFRNSVAVSRHCPSFIPGSSCWGFKNWTVTIFVQPFLIPQAQSTLHTSGYPLACCAFHTPWGQHLLCGTSIICKHACFPYLTVSYSFCSQHTQPGARHSGKISQVNEWGGYWQDRLRTRVLTLYSFYYPFSC